MTAPLLIQNIKQLIVSEEPGIKKGLQMKHLDVIESAWLYIENGLINDYGRMTDNNKLCSLLLSGNITSINASGKIVIPAFCDSHTHIVYAGTRETEFVDRINGLSYEAIAARGGGILNSAEKLRKTTAAELFDNAWQRLEEVMQLGTGAIEIKSGYGLNLESELKMLRVIKQLKEKSPLTVKATFLGAHAIPPEYKNNKPAYVDLIINEMMPAIGSEKLADYCDIFCEQNYFTADDALQILEAAKKYGMLPKVHAEQLSNSGGILAGVKAGAVSVDHLEFAGAVEIEALKHAATIPTILPGAAFFLNLPHPPARGMIDADLPLAIASDYNPGSSPSGNLQMMMSIACIQYKLTPEEALNACTINSAAAMQVDKELGSITKGKKANIIITKPVSSYNFIPYSFANNLTSQVVLNGCMVS